MGIRIKSCVSYLPPHIFHNNDFSKHFETSHQWILERTGIEERRFADSSTKTYEMGALAALNALKNASYSAQDIDAIIVATTTPDEIFPGTAVHIQREIGAKNAFAFDVQAVCAGFVYGLSIARSFILSKQAKKVLVIGCEKFSSLLDFKDRTTAILFGDGAGAMILEESDDLDDNGFSVLKSDGDFAHLLKCSSPQNIYMSGKDVFKNGILLMSNVCKELLQIENLSIKNIDCLVPHQANLRIIKGIADSLGCPLEKIAISIQKHGNTSAASIPLAFSDAVSKQQIKKGDNILFTALGGGLAWGAVRLTF